MSPGLASLLAISALSLACTAGRAGNPEEVVGPSVTAPAQQVEFPQTAAPNPDMGRLRLRCEPSDAEVSIDGVLHGLASDFAAPSFVELQPGPHRIEIRKEGYMTFRAEVVIAREVMETIPIRLAPRTTPGSEDSGSGDLE